jgi:hypothetical protein
MDGSMDGSMDQSIGLPPDHGASVLYSLDGDPLLALSMELDRI